MQFFGSSDQRFKKAKNINRKAGPGAYNLRGKPSKYDDKYSPPKSGSPFIAGEKRFMNLNDNERNVGPGKYPIKSTLLQNYKNKIKRGKNTSFGTEAKRKSDFDRSDEPLPGPGYYEGTMHHTIEHQSVTKIQESRNAYGRVIPKSSSMFLSSVKKDSSYIKPPL